MIILKMCQQILALLGFAHLWKTAVNIYGDYDYCRGLGKQSLSNMELTNDKSSIRKSKIISFMFPC